MTTQSVCRWVNRKNLLTLISKEVSIWGSHFNWWNMSMSPFILNLTKFLNFAIWILIYVGLWINHWVLTLFILSLFSNWFKLSIIKKNLLKVYLLRLWVLYLRVKILFTLCCRHPSRILALYCCSFIFRRWTRSLWI